MGLGGDDNNPADPAGPPEETAPSSTSGKENTTAGSGTRLLRVSARGESLYALLNLNKGASEEEIKKAYRRALLRYHPDKNRDDPKAEDKTKEINRARAVLTDTKKRKIYDKHGSAGLTIASKVGEDNVDAYFMSRSKYFKIAAGICFVVTGCCCCFCCFFCFCGCCGLCSKSKSDEEDGDLSDINGGSTDGGDTDEPVMNQPEASGGVNNDVFAMPDPADQ